MVNITLENVDNFSLKENLIMIDSIEILTCTHINTKRSAQIFVLI